VRPPFAAYRTISALELLATPVGVAIFGTELRQFADADGRVRVTGHTDSQGSAIVVARGMSTSFPLCCGAMGLVARLEASRLQLDPDWVPRELNQEADDLSNGIFDKFDPELRVPVDQGMVQLLMLDRLMKEGAEY
jgi:hypothetical protein